MVRFAGILLLFAQVPAEPVRDRGPFCLITIYLGGSGRFTCQVPVTAGMKVFDAIQQIEPLRRIYEKTPKATVLRCLRSARPTDYRVWITHRIDAVKPPEFLTVDWEGILQANRMETNYTLADGDEIFLDPGTLSQDGGGLAVIPSPADRLLLFLQNASEQAAALIRELFAPSGR